VLININKELKKNKLNTFKTLKKLNQINFMENQHTHAHGCSHCACNNPVLEILKEEIFSAENMAKMKPGPEQTPEPPQTLMISGGTIRPMSGGSTDTVEAIGIANGNVVATGDQNTVAAYMEQNYPGYESRELTGTQTLLPGLIEPHVHIVPTAMMSGWIDVSPFGGQDLLEKYDLDSVGDAINSNLPENSEYLILGRGLDPSLMPFVHTDGTKELQTITNTVLDSINSDRSMMLLSASMHTLYLNTKALEFVYKYNPLVNKNYPTAAAYIQSNNGQLQESLEMKPALELILPQMLAMSVDINTYLTELFQTANSRGATFMYDAGLNGSFEKLLTKYSDNNPALVRIGGAFLCSGQKEADELDTYPQVTDYKPVYYGHVKVVSDGSNQGLTGYQSIAYLCDPDNTGIFNFPETGIPASTVPPNYEDIISTVIGKGWPMMIHANGDLAVTFAIESYQNALSQYTGSELRNRIEHCSLLTAEQITTMKQMAVSPSFLIGHVGYWGHAFKEIIFGEKSQMLDLCNSALTAGMRITLHSDNEVSPLGPLRMMEQSITRVMEKDPIAQVLNAEERITPEQALVAVTYDAAWQCYADQWVGSLNEGYFADFVILAQDPLSLTTRSEQYMKMRNIPVLETWLGGVPVYIGDAL
jgi:predicted amidohydrolase YtcJ